MKRLIICYLFMCILFCGCSDIQKNEKQIFYGIDASHYQGNIDWQKVKDSGISFAYIKASEGKHYIDPKFHVNWQKIKRLNMLVGAYHFFLPEQDARIQAYSFVNIIKKNGGCKGSLPPVLDIEVIRNASKSKLQQGIKQWLEIVEAETGCRPMIYTDSGFWNKYFTNEFSEYRLWLAEYNKEVVMPRGWKHQTFWQFTQKGHVTGIKGNVDEDKFIGSSTELTNLVCN